METTRIINRLPAPTFRWLHMNQTEIRVREDINREEENLCAGKGEQKLWIRHFEAASEDKCETEKTTKIQVEDGGEAFLVQIFFGGPSETFINSIESHVSEKGMFRLIQIFLTGEKTYNECNVFLEGRKSGFSSDVCYLLDKEQRLDMNYVIRHLGQNSESNLNVHGVMDGNSKKIFRGTIDFVRGCAGAKGNEIEEVLMLSPGTRNQTIPLILCDEEDVEGNHGATIGRLSEETLFYLKSRGIKEDDIYRMMARAKIELVTSRIPDEMTREMILRRLSACHQ